MPIIESAEDFVRLQSSKISEDYLLASSGEASNEVWLDVVTRFPDYTRWVAHNKSISVDIIRLLASHKDDSVRSFIAAKYLLSVF
jgi:hypothetical protein